METRANNDWVAKFLHEPCEVGRPILLQDIMMVSDNIANPSHLCSTTTMLRRERAAMNESMEAGRKH